MTTSQGDIHFVLRRHHVQQQVAVQSAHQAILASHQAAAQNMLAHRRRNALLFALADRHVIDLPHGTLMSLGVPSSTQRVMLSAERHGHIIHQRQLAARVDPEAPDLSANRIAEALQNPMYRRAEQRAKHVWDIIGYVPSAKRHILVALKLVRRAPEPGDQLWVQTAHPVGTSTLRRHLARRTFVVLDEPPN